MLLFILEKGLDLEVIFKLIFAATLSLIIGIERELKKKPVGLKTSLVIATFSCLLTIISIETAYSTPPREGVNITMDPLRLAAQIVSGVGFLGAGVILRRGNDSITGLTTAAMIWGAAGIGIAVGAGFYILAALTVINVVIGIEVISPFLIKIGPKRLRMRDVHLKAWVTGDNSIELLVEFLKMNDMYIENIQIKDHTENTKNDLHEVTIRFASLTSNHSIKLYKKIRSLPYVEKIEIESFI